MSERMRKLQEGQRHLNTMKNVGYSTHAPGMEVPAWGAALARCLTCLFDVLIMEEEERIKDGNTTERPH